MIAQLPKLDPEDQARLQEAHTVVITVPVDAYQELLRLRKAVDTIGRMMEAEREGLKEKNEFIAVGLYRAFEILRKARWPWFEENKP